MNLSIVFLRALGVKTNDIITEKSIGEIFGVIPKISKAHNKRIIYGYCIKDLKSPNEYHGDKDKKNND